MNSSTAPATIGSVSTVLRRRQRMPNRSRPGLFPAKPVRRGGVDGDDVPRFRRARHQEADFLAESIQLTRIHG